MMDLELFRKRKAKKGAKKVTRGAKKAVGRAKKAAGAKKAYRVYINRITGNCSHQHGTTRMGNDPKTSVLNKWCQAHEVNNLYAIDGSSFPTATGINPTLTIMANAARVADHLIQQRSTR